MWQGERKGMMERGRKEKGEEKERDKERERMNKYAL